jgi:hypothetical protein
VLVRRDRAVVRIYSRNAINWTDRFSTIATVAATLEAHSFTIDGEAVVIGPDGIAQFDELRRRNGASAGLQFIAFSTATGLSRFTNIPWPKGLAPQASPTAPGAPSPCTNRDHKAEHLPACWLRGRISGGSGSALGEYRRGEDGQMRRSSARRMPA